MNGIAFKDNSGAWKNEAWKNLIPHPGDEFDSCIWLYDSQAYWDIPDFDYDIIDEMAARCLMDFPDFDMTSTHVIRKGCFRSVFPLLDIDEWTYLLGLKIKDQYLEDVLKSFALLDGFLDPEIFDFLNFYEGILITHIDGWWECFPFDHILMKNIGKNLLSAYTNSDKWVKFDQDYNIEVYPDFTAE